VEDPPSTSVASNPPKVIRWLKHQIREPLEPYFAYEDASVQDIKAAARAAGFTGITPHNTLLTYMSFKSHLQGFVSKLLGPTLIGEKGHKASDSIGTLHFADFVRRFAMPVRGRRTASNIRFTSPGLRRKVALANGSNDEAHSCHSRLSFPARPRQGPCLLGLKLLGPKRKYTPLNQNHQFGEEHR
jgi:hypothetical protein